MAWILIDEAWLKENMDKFRKDAVEELGDEGRGKLLISIKGSKDVEWIESNEWLVSEKVKKDNRDILEVSLDFRFELEDLIYEIKYYMDSLSKIKQLLSD